VRRYRRIVLPLLLLFGCSAARPSQPPALAVDPTRVFETVREREARIGSMRARFVADSQRDGEHHTAHGVLLVKKPDKFRLRMMLPFGLTVFDYVSWGAHAQLSLPLEDRTMEGPPQGELAAFTREDFGAAFLRGSDAFPGACTATLSPEHAVVAFCHDPSGVLLRRIIIAPEHATIAQETSYQAGREHMVITYSDYRIVDDTDLPHRIVLQYPGQQLTVDISVQRYEVNPVLADDLFRPVKPWAGS
jgi:outer membrane biogenesis lipoprotein LolB